MTCMGVGGRPRKSLILNRLRMKQNHKVARLSSKKVSKRENKFLAIFPYSTYTLGMKLNTLSNQEILINLGFEQTKNPDIFVRVGGAHTHRVLFMGEVVQVESQRNKRPNGRGIYWRLPNFIQALNLLEQLGVK